MGFLLNTTRKVLSLSGRGARGAIGIDLDPSTLPGQFIVKGADPRKFYGSSGTGADAGLRTDLAAGTGSGLVGFLRSASGAVVRSLLAKLGEMALSPEDFGAKGDGATDDTAALFALATAIQTMGGGTISLRPGATYRIGQQMAGGSNFRSAINPFYFYGVTGITIRGNGATLKLNDGLLYGGFEADGTPSTTGGTTASKAASYGNLITFEECRQIRVENLSLDGNMDNLVLGGSWGTGGGIQLDANGLKLYHCTNGISVENVVAQNCGTDGFYYWGKATAKVGVAVNAQLFDAASFKNCRSLFSGRTGMTLGGGTGTTISNCEFSNTGQGRIYSPTGSGIDIEPPVGYQRLTVIENSKFDNNRQQAILNGSNSYGELRVKNCEIWAGFTADATKSTKGSGDALYITFSNDPNSKVTFEDCRFHGCIPNSVAYANWVRCSWDDDIHPVYGLSAQNRAQLYANGASGRFTDCTFTILNSPQALVSTSGATTGGSRWQGCRFVYGGSAADGSSILRISGSAQFYGVNEISVTSAPATGYYVDADSTVQIYGRILWSGPIAWGSMSGQNPTTNPLGVAGSPRPQKQLALTGTDLAVRPWSYGTSAPTSGTHVQGEIVWNQSPAPGGFVGWTCTAAGTPGTWKTFGVISP